MTQRRNAQGFAMGQGPPAFSVPNYAANRLLSVPRLDTGLDTRSPSSNQSPISPGSGGPDPLALDFGPLPWGDQGFSVPDNTNSLAGISSYMPGFEGPDAPSIDQMNPPWTGSAGIDTSDPLSEVKMDLERLSTTVKSNLSSLEAPQLSEMKNLFSQTLPSLESMIQSEIDTRIMSSPGETSEDGSSYRCLLCPTSRTQEFSKRGAFKRHVTERHAPEYKYNCPKNGCTWYTHRRDKVHLHFRTSHKLVGRLTREQVNRLVVKLPAPQACGYCGAPVDSYAAYFDCLANHCLVRRNSSGETSFNGSRKNSDDSGNGGGSFNGRNPASGSFGGSGGFSGFPYGNGGGYTGGSSNVYFGQSFGYGNQYSRDTGDLHQNNCGTPENQDAHDERIIPCESSDEAETSSQVKECKDCPGYQSNSTSMQEKSPAIPPQQSPLDPSDKLEDRRAHPRRSINEVLRRILPRQPSTTETRRCRSCGHSIDNCERCQNFGAAADSCHNCADKSCVLRMPCRGDEVMRPQFGPLDPDSAPSLEKPRSLPTYREGKIRIALRSLPSSRPKARTSGCRLGESDTALQELYRSLAAIAKKQGALRILRVNRASKSGSHPDKRITHNPSKDGIITLNYIIPRLELFSHDPWCRQTIFLERNSHIAWFLQEPGSLGEGDRVFDIPFRLPLDNNIDIDEREKTGLLLESTASATCRLSLRRHSLRGTMQVVVKLLRLRASVAKTQADAEPIEQNGIEDQSLILHPSETPTVDAEVCMPYSYYLLSQIVQTIGNWNAGLIDHLPFKSLQASGAMVDGDRSPVVSAFMSTLANIMQPPGHSGSIDLSQLSFL